MQPPPLSFQVYSSGRVQTPPLYIQLYSSGIQPDTFSVRVHNDGQDLTRQMTDAIRTGRPLMDILMGFLKRTWNWQLRRVDFEVFLKPIRTAVETVAKNFKPSILYPDSIDVEQEIVFSSLMELKLIEKDVKQVYSIISKVSRSRVDSTEGIEVVLNFIDMLLHNMEDMLSYYPGLKERKRKKKFVVVPKLRRKKEVVGSITALRKKIESLEEELRFLRYFLWVISYKLEQMDDFYCQSEVLAVKAACLLCLCLMHSNGVEKMFVAEMKKELLELVAEFRRLQHKIRHHYLSIRGPVNSILNPRMLPDMDGYALRIIDSLIDYFVHHLSSSGKNYGLIVAEKDQTEILIKELWLLRRVTWFSCFYPTLLPAAEVAFMEMGYLIYLSRDDKRDEELTQKVLANLFCGIELIKKDVKEKSYSCIPETSKSYFPCLNEVVFVLNNLKELMQCKAISAGLLMRPIEELCKGLVSMGDCLTQNAELCNENSGLKILSSRFRDLAYYTELLLESFVMDVSGYSFIGHFFCLLNAHIELNIVCREVQSILEMNRDTNLNKIVPQACSSHVLSQAASPPWMENAVGSKQEVQKEEQASQRLIGLREATAEVEEKLTRGSTQLQIVSIVGKPGLGKTTLAYSLYRSLSVNIHFHVHAWCCTSPVYHKETLLSDIFYQIVWKTNKHCKDDGDIVQKLHQSLEGRRYLVVIDDVWDIGAWDSVKGAFPDNNNGSRIVFTTRHSVVALQANSHPYHQRLLSRNESLELFHLELFGKETCSPESWILTKQIAENCKGLPLSLILIAGVLKRTERKRESWDQVSNTLIKAREVDDILELSYMNLPEYLKACFLYFAAFPKDTTISVSKLIRLWVSEGFVRQPGLGLKSSEQEAEKYLNELIDRSLVMIAERSSRGGVKSCRVHDLLRDFCLEKAEQECFLLQEKRYQQLNSHLLHYRLCISSSLVEETSPPSQGDWGNTLDPPAWEYIPHVRSLLYYYKPNKGLEFDARDEFSEADDAFYGSPTIHGLRLIHLPLLRVLDLTNVHYRNSSAISDLVVVAKLVHLRYIALRVRARVNEIPEEFQNLKNLETFLLTGAVGDVIFPEEFWELPRLRHVHITNQAILSFQYCSEEFFQKSHQLENLKTFSMPSLCCGTDETILRRLTRLQKLKCRFLNSWDDSTHCNNFPILTFLNQLESLKVSCSGKAQYPCTFHFPPCLKKLTLLKFRLPWKEISVIGRMLPNLEVLKILKWAFAGRHWRMEEDAFGKLKFLKLDSLDIEDWDASGENFPSLEQLVVVRCQNLREIPPAVGKIPTLKLIEMKWCSSSATNSVKQILQDQRDYSNYQLQANVVGP